MIPETDPRLQRLLDGLFQLRYRILAVAVVCVAAAVGMFFSTSYAEAPDPPANSAAPLRAVAITGADVSGARMSGVNAATGEAAVASSYSVTVSMYDTTRLQSFAVQGWQATLYTVRYTSSDESIAAVDGDGTVHGIAAGEAVITATATDVDGRTASAQCTVTVLYADPPLEGITLNRSKVTLRMGGTGSNLTVSCTPGEYAPLLAPVFSSSDESVCVVDAAGHITAVAPGQAVVTAEAFGWTAECAVTVKDTQTVNTGGISLLNFDHSMIAAIGNQTSGKCSLYALRYARTILDGSVCSGAGMWSNGAVWSAGGYYAWSGDLSSCLTKLYDEINAGRPVIVHLQNTYVGTGKHPNRTSTYEYWESAGGWSAVDYPHIATSAKYGHWVCVVGYREGADPANLRESDFYALDPARVTDGSRICVTSLLDGTIWTSNSPLKVAG